ncbi:tetratricopeptide repeat-containing diguanylate cyclase [Kangiella sediminilitoris]|uniref:diguanylate cyclase n=1 Tax=Kangiella sediminilitoris TaxID=1144748 RepID=A0A1B3B7P2_9GAMM|nr:diguanylate cyclase [Kangiella sediminilitoris]AOE48798.1 hypothetical protein KS2013_66 [Kangiella sediminilitoris]
MLQTFTQQFLCFNKSYDVNRGRSSQSRIAFSNSNLRVIALLFFLLTSVSVSYATDASNAEDSLNEQQVAFDKLYESIDTGEVEIVTLEDRDEYMASLEAAIPEGDDIRRRRYEFYVCMTGYGFEFSKGIEVAEQYIAEAKQAEDQEAIARFYYCLAEFQASTSLWKNSIESINASIEASKSIGHKEYWAWGLAFRCSIRSLVGEFAESLVDCLKARELYGQANKEATGDELLFDIGIAYRRIGFNDKALEYFNEMEELAVDQGLLLGQIQTIIQKSFIFYNKEMYAEALDLQKKALELADEQEDYNGQAASARVAMAGTLIKLHRYSEAKQQLDQAQELINQFGITNSNEMIEMQMGMALDGLEQPELAVEYYDRAEDLMKRGGNRRYLSMLYEARSKNYEMLGQEKEALQMMQKHLELSRILEKDREQQQILVLRYQFDSERSDLENKKLVAEKKLKETEVEALKKTQRWQLVAIVLGGLLSLVLVILIVRQFGLSKRLKQQALTDSLTGVANRRHIESYCKTVLEQAKQHSADASIIVFDIDNFKQINDKHGHVVGDEVLKKLSEFCQTMLRQLDKLGRYGGEEFLVVLPQANLENAYQVAERLRLGLQQISFGSNDQPFNITVSLGVAEYDKNETMDQLIDRADEALYRAKSQGRNMALEAKSTRENKDKVDT